MYHTTGLQYLKFKIQLFLVTAFTDNLLERETSVIISPELWFQTAQIYESGSLQNLGRHAAIGLGFCSKFHGENDGETILKVGQHL